MEQTELAPFSTSMYKGLTINFDKSHITGFPRALYSMYQISYQWECLKSAESKHENSYLKL